MRDAVKKALFGTVRDLCFAPDGTVFIQDARLVVRKVTPAGQVTSREF